MEEQNQQQKYIVRAYSSGVFFGQIEYRNGKEVAMVNARRLWYWDGAASLSQMAMEGVKNPSGCKFPISVKRVILTEVIEILECTEQAVLSIESVPVWQR